MDRTASVTLPHDVARRHLVEDVSLLRAWREYLDMTQAGLAARLGVSQAQAAAMELHVVQLTLTMGKA